MTIESAPGSGSPCQSCGACCAYSRDWPRFTTESDEEIELIPKAFVDQGLSRMRSVGERCSALAGQVGLATSCTLYNVRPHVCRACEPGDDACLTARAYYGLSW